MTLVYFNWRGMVSRIVFFYKVSSLDPVCKLWPRYNVRWWCSDVLPADSSRGGGMISVLTCLRMA